MTPEERKELIDQLDRSWQVMERWVKASFKHAAGVPKINRNTGEPFKTFREVCEAASDESLLIWKQDFEDNGDLLPAVPTQ